MTTAINARTGDNREGGNPTPLTPGAAILPAEDRQSIRRISVGTGAQLALRIVSAVMGALVWALLSRSLGPSAFGVFSLILALQLIGQSVSDLGTSVVGVREMAQRPMERGRIMAAMMGVQLALGAVLYVIMLVVLLLLLHTRQDRITGAVALLGLMFGVLNELQAIAQVRLRTLLMGLVQVMMSAIWLIVVIVLAMMKAPLVWYGLGFVMSGVLQGICMWALTRGLVRLDWRNWTSEARKLLRQSLLYGVAMMLVLAYYKVDSLIVFHDLGARQAGFYAAGYRVIDVLQLIGITASSVVLPLVSGMVGDRRQRRRRQTLYAHAMTYAGCVALLATVLCVVFGPVMISVVFGRRYVPAGPYLQVLALSLAPMTLAVLIGNVVVAGKLTREFFCITLIGAMVNIGFNLWLVPRYGAMAAAWINVATECLVALLLASIAWFRLETSFPWIRGIALMCFAAVAGVAMQALDSHVLVSMLVGTSIFCGLVLVTNVIRLSELRTLVSRHQVVT